LNIFKRKDYELLPIRDLFVKNIFIKYYWFKLKNEKEKINCGEC